ncbi:hypothetical protein BDBG_16500 [Blastomyces gilchristii SLH14081]|uniref:Uncharacterized protein n=1 Tax=Blastomyces gilchristii (strain SLH14081) TaxID=559298 RepID=A0A179UCX9_BLAGS|nr:uncharacterized protein BDBG_16500 [Blastomyces gilchristii SLH14081]OAT05856.1 hypothetical protein BDBG_16500 [Blastomyces gilchristii SLH14081]
MEALSRLFQDPGRLSLRKCASVRGDCSPWEFGSPSDEAVGLGSDFAAFSNHEAFHAVHVTIITGVAHL